MNIALFISNDYGLDLYDLLKKNNFNISLIVTRYSKIFHNKRFINIDNKDITHVDGEINPIRDIETINTELILKDIETVEKRINSISKLAKSGDKNAQKEYELMLLIVDELNDGNMIYSINLNTSQKILIKSFSLLTSKPMIFVANISEEELANSNNNNMKMSQTLQ